MRKIILASASPRRKELLEKLGIKFKIEPSNYDENVSLKLRPRKLAEYLSYKKAEAVAANYDGAIIIGADTIVVFKSKIFGKPKNKEDAKKILSKLSGKVHFVITGFSIIDIKNNKKIIDSVKTKVYFKNLSKEKINDYVASGEPLDKTGAYGIQGRGIQLIEKIEGDYSNVVGLPLKDLKDNLKEFGVDKDY